MTDQESLSTTVRDQVMMNIKPPFTVWYVVETTAAVLVARSICGIVEDNDP